MKHILMITALLLGTSSFATSLKKRAIEDIKSAVCTNDNGGSFNLSTETNVVTASFSQMTKLTNKYEDFDEELFVEVLEDFPTEAYDAIGTLVVGLSADQNHIFGNASLLFTKDQQISAQTEVLAYFIDQAGDDAAELMNCEITFKEIKGNL